MRNTSHAKLLADIFPAIVSLINANLVTDINSFLPNMPPRKGIRKLNRCRVVVFPSEVLIAIDSPDGPRLVFRENHVYYKKEDRVHRIITDTGKAISFSKRGTCACGSRLVSWNPYKPTVKEGE